MEIVPAKRRSKNGEAGVPEIKPIIVTSGAYLEMVTSKLLPAIRRKMLWLKGDEIIIQHDGAKAHNGNGNFEYLNEAGQDRGFNIRFVTQPAQSPDLNMNDLAFFHSLNVRAEEIKGEQRSMEAIVQSVEAAYNAYSTDTLSRIYAMQFAIFREILAHEGGNGLKIPHSGIRKAQDHGLVSEDLTVDDAVTVIAEYHDV